MSNLRKERFNQAYKYLVYSNEIGMKKDLAEKMSTSSSYISQALSGSKVVLNNSFLRRFCSIFPQFSLDWLINGEGEMLVSDKNGFLPEAEKSKENIQTERTAENNIIEAYALLIRDVEKHHRELIDEIAAMRELRTIIEKEREEIHIIQRMLSQILYTARNSDPTTLFPSDPSITLPFAAEPDLAPLTTDPSRSEQVRSGQERGQGRSEQVRKKVRAGQSRSGQVKKKVRAGQISSPQVKTPRPRPTRSPQVQTPPSPRLTRPRSSPRLHTTLKTTPPTPPVNNFSHFFPTPFPQPSKFLLTP